MIIKHMPILLIIVQVYRKTLKIKLSKVSKVNLSLCHGDG